MDDILVDHTVAKNFCNPVDPHYKTFIKWLQERGVLVVTQSLIGEYSASSAASPSTSSMPAIINLLTQKGRLRKFSKEQLDNFRFTNAVRRRLRSNRKDHVNIKAVMLSTRKFALSHDADFRYDVNNFPRHAARAEIRPQDIPYAERYH